MALKALTTIKHGSGRDSNGERQLKTFNVGDTVSGLDKEAMESLQASGSIGTEQDLAQQNPDAGAEEITRLQARIAELEGTTQEPEVNADPISEAANAAAEKEAAAKGNK